jgi:hypothetical protein
MNADAQLWVEVVGDLIIARVRGEPTAALLRECQERVRAVSRQGRGTRQGAVRHARNVRAADRVFYNDMVAAVKWLSDERPD